MSETPTTAATGTVTSVDGTAIGYRRFGHGPAVILVHGGMQASQNFRKLAAELADEFEVFVPDRRGRGMSGSYGDHCEVERDVEDMQALVAASGATRIFGLSSGATDRGTDRSRPRHGAEGSRNGAGARADPAFHRGADVQSRNARREFRGRR
jgi:alpha-beta hydrolase superfamily lysophospholipase